jgi:hypothetical protein
MWVGRSVLPLNRLSPLHHHSSMSCDISSWSSSSFGSSRMSPCNILTNTLDVPIEGTEAPANTLIRILLGLFIIKVYLYADRGLLGVLIPRMT